jgi:MFS transporter, DHA1 family, tetracycline resistance protein
LSDPTGLLPTGYIVVVKASIPATVWLMLFVDATASAIALPVIPKLVQQTVNGNVALTALCYGAMLATVGLILFFVSPLQAALADRFGRKTMLLLSCLGSVLSAIAVAFSSSLPCLFCAFIFRSFAGASQPVAASYISEAGDPHKRTTDFATLSAMVTSGFIVGAFLGGLLGNFDLRFAMWVAAFCSLLSCLFVLTLKEQRAPDAARLRIKIPNPIDSCKFLYARAPLRELTFIMLCGDFAFQVFLSTWVLYSALLFHWSIAQAGASLSFQGVLSVVVQLVLLRYALPRFGANRTLIASLLFDALALLLYNVIDGSWLVTIVIAMHACGAAVKPTCIAALSKEVEPAEQNKLQGAIATQGALNNIFAPLLGTLLFSYFTSASAPVTLPGAPFFLGFMAILASLIMASLPVAKSIRQGVTNAV